MNIFIASHLLLCIFSFQNNFGNASAKNSFKFEIQFNIADAEYKQDEIDEEMTKAFIGEMKKLINTNVPTNISAEKKCEKFKNAKDEKSKRMLALESLRNMIIGKDKSMATDHCLHNWILYFNLTEITIQIVKKLKESKDFGICERILGPKIADGMNMHTAFLDNLNTFSNKISKQLNVGRLRSMTIRAISFIKRNDAFYFYELLKTLNVQIRMKKIEEIEIIEKKNTKKSVKFEINFEIIGQEIEEVTMNEVRTTAFIAEIKKLVDRKIPKFIDNICEKFKGNETEMNALKSISMLLRGEDKFNATNNCMHKWILYLFLGKISKEIVEHLKMAKNHKIYERILGTTKVDEQWKFMKNLNNFLEEVADKLTPTSNANIATSFNGKNVRVIENNVWKSKEKKKFYDLLKELKEKLTVKMEGTDDEKEEEKKNKSPSRSRKETPIFTDNNESSVSSFELSEEENGQNHHVANSKLQQKEKKLEKMEGKLQKQQNELKEMQNLKNKLQKELKEMENQIQSHEKEIGKIQKEIDEMKRLIEELKQKEGEEKQRRLRQRQKAKENKAKQRKTPRPRARQETTFQHIQQSSHTYVQNGYNYGSPLLCTFHYSSLCQTSYPIY